MDESGIQGFGLFKKNGGASTSLIAVRSGGVYKNKSFYLNDLFSWWIKRDELGGLCLIPTKK